jgi:hypothetical protein
MLRHELPMHRNSTFKGMAGMEGSPNGDGTAP